MRAYNKKTDNTYDFRTLKQMLRRCEALGCHIPADTDLSVLKRQPVIKAGTKDYTLANSLTVHPMEGFDSEPDGSPSELSRRRYMRFAGSGASLLWLEASAVVPEGRTNDRQFMITAENSPSYAVLIEEIRKKTDAPFIAQLTHSGRFSHNALTPHGLFITKNPPFERVRPQDAGVEPVSDEYLDSLPESFANAAKEAIKAGFDGVDVKVCHQYLFSEALSAYTREGKYGGSYENRTRLIKDTFAAVSAVLPADRIMASRFGVSDMIEYPYGFGVKQDALEPDYTEAVKLLCELRDGYGLSLIDMTMGSPYYNPHVNRPYNLGGYKPDEHPLEGVARIIDAARAVKQATEGITVIGTGYSYLREFAPYAAAGALKEGCCDAVGFGRMAFACPDFAEKMLSGSLKLHDSCVACSKCTQLMRAGGPTGCPVRDCDGYLSLYRRLIMGKDE